MFPSQSVLLSHQKQPVSAKQHAQMEGIPIGTPHILHDSQRSSATDQISNMQEHTHFHFCVFLNVRSLFSDNKCLKPESSFQVSFFCV